MQEHDLGQEIEKLIEVANMELEPEPKYEYVNLMPNPPNATIQTPALPVTDLVSSEEGEIVPLDDDLVMDVYNLSFDELQKRIVQAQRNNFMDDHASPAFNRERVIVPDTNKNPNSIFEAKLDFTGVVKYNTQYLMAENKNLVQNIQAS